MNGNAHNDSNRPIAAICVACAQDFISYDHRLTCLTMLLGVVLGLICSAILFLF